MTEEASVVSVGEKVHVVSRRLFDGDLRRHFAGVVVACSGPVARLEGYVFVFDSQRNQWERRERKRTRIADLGDSGLIANVIPAEVDLEELHYKEMDGRLVLLDGAGFTLDINEFGASR